MLTEADKEASAGAKPVVVSDEDGEAVVRLSGNWTTRRAGKLDKALRAVDKLPASEKLTIDLSEIGRIDTAGAWLIKRLAERRKEAGGTTEIVGGSQAADILLAAVDEAAAQAAPAPPPHFRFSVAGMFAAIGKVVVNAGDDMLQSANILGATVRGGQMKIGRGHSINPAAIVNQIDRMGVGAIPVVLLMSSIVGAIVAQQGAFQLRYFGAEIFVVDLVGILVLREMGVLLTAIMIAGRSGSAITAEIGSMKMREEVDALTVIGLNPIGVLVFPRLVALIVALPCLTVIADFAAIGGAMAVAWAYSGIPPQAFIDRMRDAIDVSTILVGLIKAPFMAMIIGIIASVEGMKVGGSAESLGRQVTTSVVKAIFVVVVVDGMFAIFFAQIDF
jgi:phospholipid/cholesterol/gamma-HCH transport system permease protein